MNTAREIIARPLAWTGIALDQADAILSALAAEGFSIVETGRHPVTIEAIRAILDDDDADVYEKLGDIRAALSRSTREGKTE